MTPASDVVEKDHPYRAAGRVWRVPELRLARLADGGLAVSLAEVERVHRSIANAICGVAGELTVEELDFLCDVTSSTSAEVASTLGLHRTTLSKWRSGRSALSPLVSRALKWWFWFRLFGDGAAGQEVSFSDLPDPEKFLELARERAVALHLTDPVAPLKLAS